MSGCHDCGGRFGASPSCFEGFDLLACVGCGRPIGLIKLGMPRLRSAKLTERDRKRALRAARRRLA